MNKQLLCEVSSQKKEVNVGTIVEMRCYRRGLKGDYMSQGKRECISGLMTFIEEGWMETKYNSGTELCNESKELYIGCSEGYGI